MVDRGDLDGFIVRNCDAMSIRAMARATGVSKSTVHRHLASLRESGEAPARAERESADSGKD